MEQLNQLINGISKRVSLNLTEYDFDTDHFVHSLTDQNKLLEYCASYDATSKAPFELNFHECNIAGSYFLGNCRVDKSVVYKSDVRGDELKQKGDPAIQSESFILSDDEVISITNSFLCKTLIHSKSYNSETPENFFIKNTIASHYSNIHGSTLEGSCIGAFTTIDRTALHSCLVGDFSYIQAHDLFHKELERGTVWFENENYSFRYTYPETILNRYISLGEDSRPTGILYEFTEKLKTELEKMPPQLADIPVDKSHPYFINHFAVIKGNTRIGKDVSICQRAFIENAEIGDNATVQENTYVINSKLLNYTIITHGGKAIHSTLGMNVFTGMNSFLNGKVDAEINIGDGCIILPHTIIDPVKQITIPPDQLIWGYISAQEDVATHSVSLKELNHTKKISMEGMVFEGKGNAFVEALKHRIDLIAQNRTNKRVQSPENTSVFVIQPYGTGPKTGIYPTLRIEE